MATATAGKRKPRVLLACTGSVASIKVPELAQRLCDLAEVRVTQFLGSLLFSCFLYFLSFSFPMESSFLLPFSATTISFFFCSLSRRQRWLLCFDVKVFHHRVSIQFYLGTSTPSLQRRYVYTHVTITHDRTRSLYDVHTWHIHSIMYTTTYIVTSSHGPYTLTPSHTITTHHHTLTQCAVLYLGEGRNDRVCDTLFHSSGSRLPRAARCGRMVRLDGDGRHSPPY